MKSNTEQVANDDAQAQAYAQWVTITILPNNYKVTIKNLKVNWGKLYDSRKIGEPADSDDSKDHEYQPEQIEGRVVEAGEMFSINACGRSAAWSGTSGSFDIYDGENHVGTYSWDCPWGSPTNSSQWTTAPGLPRPINTPYVQLSGGSKNGALGKVLI
ncbi:MAG: aegerolysin family protein, partial [Pseudomonadales bacterium]|nr:aegerolysin family protein [Pseudomonadales bacterium]